MNEWQKIETAPKYDDNGETVNVLLLFQGGEVSVAYWDAYYAEGGSGYGHDGGLAWIEPISGERLDLHCGTPTHWMPKPEAPPHD